MAILWQKVKARTASALGVLDGADVSSQETNYTGTIDISALDSPDWTPTEIQDACVESVMEIARWLIEAQHPEADTFNVSSAAVASGVAVPTTSSGGVPRIGKVWRVKDSANSRPLKRASVDQVRDFINASSTVFNGATLYWFAEDGAILLHTRTNVICEFGGFTRASITVNIGGSDVIPLVDHHESAIVDGAICKLAPKETSLMELYAAAEKRFQAHREMIFAYGQAAEGQR